MDDVSVVQLLDRLDELDRQLISLQQSSTSVDSSWVFRCAVLVFLMQIGFAMLESGVVREQNVVTTYAKNLFDLVLGVFSACGGGFALAYPEAGRGLYVNSAGDRALVHQSFFVHMTFQAATATIVSGAMAERTGLIAYLTFSVLISGIIYPLGVRWTWGGGWLSQLDTPFHDFAGSGVVHMVGGVASLTGCLCVGARSGRWDPIMQRQFVPHNTSSVIGGTFMLWLGWYGFNPGSQGAISSVGDREVVANAFTTTTFSAGAGGLIILATAVWQTKGGADILGVCNGILAGLVAITAGCDSIDPNWSVLVGAVAGCTYMWSSRLLRQLRVDDVVDAFPVHGVGGLWGLMAVGLFHRDRGLVLGHGPNQLLSQLAGALALFSATGSISAAFCLSARFFGFLRVTLDEEAEGLDSRLKLRAYGKSSKAMVQCRVLHDVLASCGMSPLDCIRSLEYLKTIIHRPFSPHAADNKLQGETKDILRLLDFGSGGEEFEYLTFLSYKPTNGMEVARILAHTMRRLLLESTLRDPSTRVSTRASEVVHKMRDDHLVFLNLTNVRDFRKLRSRAAGSKNHMLLLTAGVLERPSVLVEVIQAFQMSKNFICVLVEWQDRERDVRQFNFPADLEEALALWERYIRKEGNFQHPLNGFDLHPSTDVTDSSVTSKQTDQDTSEPRLSEFSTSQ